MRVILIDVNYKNSSTGKIVHDIARQLIADGHVAKVLYGRGLDLSDRIGEKISFNWENYLHAMMTRLSGLVGFFSYFSTRRLIKRINEFRPDVVHLHELHGYYVNIKTVIDFLKEMKIPVIWTFHCEFMYTGKCGHAYSCEQWKTECIKCPQLRVYPASLFFDFTNFMFNQKKEYMKDFHRLHIVSPSKWLADRVEESFLQKKKISIIHNGIDTRNIFFPRESKHLLDKHNLVGKKIILAVAPKIMDENKGGIWVIKLAEQFDDNYCFVMIGLEGELLSHPRNLIPIRRTNNQIQLAEYYSMADIFLICSKRENFPTTCLEALACGTPVIGFDEGGTAETAPTPYGHFVPYGDLDAIKEYIEKFFRNQVELRSSRECRDFAVQNYSKESMYSNYLKLFNESIDRKK